MPLGAQDAAVAAAVAAATESTRKQCTLEFENTYKRMREDLAAQERTARLQGQQLSKFEKAVSEASGAALPPSPRTRVRPCAGRQQK